MVGTRLSAFGEEMIQVGGAPSQKQNEALKNTQEPILLNNAPQETVFPRFCVDTL